MRIRVLLTALVAAVLALGTATTASAAPHAGVSVKTSKHSVLKGGSVTLSARGHHAPAGTHVVFQEQKHGRWVKDSPWKSRSGGAMTYRFTVTGTYRFRAAVAKASGAVIAHSRITTVHVTAPKPKLKPTKPSPSTPAKHACTTTSTGSCIQGGEFCPQADYGQTGWDANGTAWVCKGDTTHPHWEH